MEKSDIENKELKEGIESMKVFLKDAEASLNHSWVQSPESPTCSIDTGELLKIIQGLQIINLTLTVF